MNIFLVLSFLCRLLCILIHKKMLLRIIVIILLIFNSKLGAETKKQFQCSDVIKKEYQYKNADFEEIKNCLREAYHHNDSKSIAETILKINSSLEENSYELGVINAYQPWLYIYICAKFRRSRKIHQKSAGNFR